MSRSPLPSTATTQMPGRGGPRVRDDAEPIRGPLDLEEPVLAVILHPAQPTHAGPVGRHHIDAGLDARPAAAEGEQRPVRGPVRVPRCEVRVPDEGGSGPVGRGDLHAFVATPPEGVREL